MLKTTLIGLGAGALLSLAAAATPAFANYGHCSEEPDSADCRTYNMPGLAAGQGHACSAEHAQADRPCP